MPSMKRLSLLLFFAGCAHMTQPLADSRHYTMKLGANETGGLGFSPEPVWLDDNRQLFASASSWAQILPDGWMPVAEEVVKLEEQARDAEVAQIAQRLTHKPQNGLLIVKNARLFDPATLKVTPNTTIWVRGNVIDMVAVRATFDPPPGATVIDAAGKTVIPGLWDMHVHLGGADGLMNIANGVTTVRDLANDVDFLLGLRKKFDDGS